MIPLFVFLLAGVAVYLGAIEAAFSALMRLSLRLSAERIGRPDALEVYLDDPLLLFVPVRLLLAVTTAAAAALLVRATGVEGAHGLALAFLSIAAFVVIFGLLLPLLIVSRHPERWLELILPWFEPVARALGPVARGIARSVATAKRPVAPVTGDEIAEHEAELTNAYPESATLDGLMDGHIDGEERKLLQSIVDFGDTLVREVMTPRPDIVGIRESAIIADLRALFREEEYSRFPVFKESLDNIAGFVFVKDLVALDASDDRKPLTQFLRPAVVVPESKRVSELLKQFQRQQTQIAIVVDEYGGTAGLVTIEDMLEEIVGEIRDEYDVESEPIVDEGGGRFTFHGKVDVDEVKARLNVHIEREGFETVGGFLLTRLGRVPAVGERFVLDGLNVEVLEVERRRIHKVRITRLQQVESQERERAL